MSMQKKVEKTEGMVYNRKADFENGFFTPITCCKF